MRWLAIATYKTGAGPLEVMHDIEELDELAELIEAGPDWNTLIDIKITLNRKLYDATVEEAEHPDFDPFPIDGAA